MKSKDRSLIRRSADGLRGMAHGWRREQSLRTQVSLSLLGLAVLVLLGAPLAWDAAFAAMIAVGFAAELFNGSIEALLDRLHPERHPEIGAAKDMSSAAVLVVNIASAAIFAGAIIVWLKD